jgi:tetratricopeptide (TPR) repeat protein
MRAAMAAAAPAAVPRTAVAADFSTDFRGVRDEVLRLRAAADRAAFRRRAVFVTVADRFEAFRLRPAALVPDFRFATATSSAVSDDDSPVRANANLARELRHNAAMLTSPSILAMILGVSLLAAQPSAAQAPNSTQQPAPAAAAAANPLLEAAENHADSGRHAEAFAAYTKVLASDPQSVEAQLGAGRALDFLGRHAEARRHYAKAIEAAKADARAQALSAMAISYAFESNAAEAAGFYQKLFDERMAAGNPSGAAGTANALGRVYLETGDYANAEKWYRTGYETSKQIAGLEPAQRDLWLMRWHNAQSRIAARRGNAAEARKHAESLNEILAKGQNEGERPQYQYLLGYIALEAGEPDRAIADLEKGNLTDPFVLGLIGRAYEKNGDAANARAYYTKVLAAPAHSINSAFARRWARAYLKQ